MSNRIRSVCVFCGSRPGTDPAFERAARELGATLGERGLRLVYGGSHLGLMGTVADAAMSAGAEVVGVIPEDLVGREAMHTGLTECHVVDSMHARKRLMFDLAGAFVALPGGFGTFEEILEMITWRQLGYHVKPLGLVDVSGYFSSLIEFFEHATSSGFVSGEHRALVLSDASARGLLDRMVPPG